VQRQVSELSEHLTLALEPVQLSQQQLHGQLHHPKIPEPAAPPFRLLSSSLLNFSCLFNSVNFSFFMKIKFKLIKRFNDCKENQSDGNYFSVTQFFKKYFLLHLQ
jgi:hypothetical protein